jgi:NADH dehydrogenase
LESLQLPVDGGGRAIVQVDLSVPGEPWIFVIGDAAHCPGVDGHPLSGLAPVALEQGQYVARVIRERIPPDQRSPFHYLDRGFMSIIGRAKAIAQIGSLQVSGFPAWLMWCFVHILFLIGFHNRVRVMAEWVWYYITFKPGGRLMYWRPLFVNLKQRAAESEATRRG